MARFQLNLMLETLAKKFEPFQFSVRSNYINDNFYIRAWILFSFISDTFGYLLLVDLKYFKYFQFVQLFFEQLHKLIFSLLG